MAPPVRGRLKGFYRETKKGAGAIVKQPPKKRWTKNANKLQHCAAIIQQQGAADVGDRGPEDKEVEFRQFDMDMTYGPCIGVTRLRRSASGT